MKTVTLNSIEWIKSPNFYEGRSQKVNAIVIHWWDDPANKPSMAGVINGFKRTGGLSCHFVVSGDRVVQMVNMGNQAWHAGPKGNPATVGIEVDPRVPGNTYETVGALVRFIRGYYGNIPLRPHSYYFATRCPGTLDLKKIDAIAKGTYTQPAPKPAPAPTPTKPIYRVYLGTVQKGAYTVEKNAWQSFVDNKGTKITKDHKDVTDSLVKKYAPAPAPKPTAHDAAQDAQIKANTEDISTLKAFYNLLKNFFSNK